MKKIFGALVLAVGLVTAAVPAFAAVELETRAFIEVAITDTNGVQSKELQPVERAQPGQEVVFVITYRNTGEEPAENLVVNNRVPKEMVYVADSAQGESALIQVSVDGNRFGSLQSLQVTEADGSVRAAKASDVVALRWTLQGAVAPGDSGSVRYRAVLK
ncbi:DUF11 domain-containing protein [Microbulbifer salipaludis]|uniref:DUF11 domain-containing protein n=1 Tax=Microbulbifer salipaludis TaxID=187980 RepID=A0ABS3E4Y3_9GAMM|nr:DUF11 domain-containing protein [Microbulbifer salipaludis]MBN8430366.1 DUF11 domain-containing protein [Microbulbifer salipaludis]